MIRHQLLTCALLAALALSAHAARIDIPGPPGSSAFGSQVRVLPNGNFVVIDPSGGPLPNAGAVYLYSPSGSLISTLTGDSSGDQVGSFGMIVLSNGNFVVCSSTWDNGDSADVGAVTWVNGGSGLSGVVSAANSLIGSTASDYVGAHGITALSNGNYVVRSANWDNGASIDAGAITWAPGSTGRVGTVSPANSLVGTSSNDSVGRVMALSNGNFVISNAVWDNGDIANVGAVTWGDGSAGLTGTVSTANSLVGTTVGDSVGNVVPLSNGNYVVVSQSWDNGASPNVGAVTWADGSSGLVGTVSTANSLYRTVGSGTFIGNFDVTALRNGNYVVRSFLWNNGPASSVGAVTWANGNTGLAGAVGPANSLIGSTSGDSVGGGGITALSNGNYVVASSGWDNGSSVNVGAVTWADGSSGLTGVVSAANSLIGTQPNDYVGGGGVAALSNGNYVVRSNQWNNGGNADVGALTWGNGSSGLVGVVASGNSFIGSSSLESVGGVTALSNGNYVISNPGWDNGSLLDVGAVTWADGNIGLVGAVSPSNSLVGTSQYDFVGGIIALSDGNYLVSSGYWDNGASQNVGAVTWASGNSGLTGVVSPINSLIGTTEGDSVGAAVECNFVCPPGPAPVSALEDGSYVVHSFYWDLGSSADIGALTLGRGSVGAAATITTANSVLGLVPGQGTNMTFDFDAAREQLVVGLPASNMVSLFTLPGDPIFVNGFELENGHER